MSAAHRAEASWKVVYWKEEDHTPAMQSSLLPEVRRLQVEPSQHCAAMAIQPCVVASASWTHASVSELPSRIRTPCGGKVTAGGGEGEMEGGGGVGGGGEGGGGAGSGGAGGGGVGEEEGGGGVGGGGVGGGGEGGAAVGAAVVGAFLYAYMSAAAVRVSSHTLRARQ